MAMKYNVLDLNSMTRLPKSCNCQDINKMNGLKDAVINAWHKFKDHETMPLIIIVEGIEYLLVSRDWKNNGLEIRQEERPHR